MCVKRSCNWSSSTEVKLGTILASINWGKKHSTASSENVETIAQKTVLALSLEKSCARDHIKTRGGHAHQLSSFCWQWLAPILVPPQQRAFFIGRRGEPAIILHKTGDSSC